MPNIGTSIINLKKIKKVRGWCRREQRWLLFNFCVHWYLPSLGREIPSEVKLSITVRRFEEYKRIRLAKYSPAGNRTPVSRVTGGDTDHYTTEDACKRRWKTGFCKGLRTTPVWPKFLTSSSCLHASNSCNILSCMVPNEVYKFHTNDKRDMGKPSE